jgi:hypothetical protein
MAGVRGRLDRLEASLSPHHVDTGARERLEAKLAAISEAHRVRRQRGEKLNLERQSMACLLGLIASYPYGAVPPEVAQAARSKVQQLSHGPHSPTAKVLHLCLESRGYRGN